MEHEKLELQLERATQHVNDLIERENDWKKKYNSHRIFENTLPLSVPELREYNLVCSHLFDVTHQPMLGGNK